MDTIVAKIKELQRTDDNAKQQWWAYCDSKGNGVRDPAKHNMAFLRVFVTSFEKGVPFEVSKYQSGDTSMDAMVAEIKRLQKSDKDAKAQWSAYCASEGGGVNDPAKHDSEFLHAFLLNHSAGMRFESTPTESYPDQPWAGASKDELVEHVKGLQRGGDRGKEQWWAFSDSLGSGMRDPAKHDIPTLKKFINGFHSGTAFEGARGSLADLFKEGQRRSKVWKDTWGSFCDSRNTQRDPSKHDSKFLVEFFDVMGQGAAIAMTAMGGVAVKRTGSILNGPPAKMMRSGSTPRIGAGGGNMEAMVKRIKDFQRAGGKEMWAEYCNANMEGVRDPAKHTHASLKAFITGYGVP